MTVTLAVSGTINVADTSADNTNATPVHSCSRENVDASADNAQPNTEADKREYQDTNGAKQPPSIIFWTRRRGEHSDNSCIMIRAVSTDIDDRAT